MSEHELQINLRFFKGLYHAEVHSFFLWEGFKYFIVCFSMILLQYRGVLCFSFWYFSVVSLGRTEKWLLEVFERFLYMCCYLWRWLFCLYRMGQVLYFLLQIMKQVCLLCEICKNYLVYVTLAVNKLSRKKFKKIYPSVKLFQRKQKNPLRKY